MNAWQVGALAFLALFSFGCAALSWLDARFPDTWDDYEDIP